MHLEELEQNIPQENLEFSRAKSTFREPPENAQTKAVIQGFIPLDEALQDMDHTEFPSKKPNFYLVKKQSKLPSNQSHVLGVRELYLMVNNSLSITKARNDFAITT